MPPGDQNGKYPALRVSQLDASELDSELHNILKSQFLGAFRYLPTNLLHKIEPELNAILRFAVWNLSLNAFDSTIGQRMLDLKYKNNSIYTQEPGWISKKQKILYAAFTIGLSWLQDRSPFLLTKIDDQSSLQVIPKVIGTCEKIFKLLSLLNYVIFLYKGKYQFILERLLGIEAVYPQRQLVRQVSFDYMSRELLWHGFAEFLFFILPYINFRRIKNIASKYLLRIPEDQTRLRCPADYKQCVVCNEWPCHPHEIGCVHVFCYYCVSANLKADPSFSCPACGVNVAQVKPVLITIEN